MKSQKRPIIVRSKESRKEKTNLKNKNKIFFKKKKNKNKNHIFYQTDTETSGKTEYNTKRNLIKPNPV